MFELGKFLSSTAKGGNGKVRDFFTDPIKVSFVLAAIIVLIIYFIFRDIVDEDESFFHIMFRAGLFILIAVVSVVFIHNKNIETEYESKYSDTGAKTIVKRGVESAADDIDVHELAKLAESAKPAAEAATAAQAAQAAQATGAAEEAVAKDSRVNVNITVNDSIPPVKSGAFKPPK
jgi:hypothetical protein